MNNRISLFFFVKVVSYILFILCITNSQTYAQVTANHPFYFGIGGGYGSTTWGQLVPSQNKTSVAMSMSTPTSVSEGGAIWNVFLGYELMPTFSVEGSYTRYPVAKVYFDEMSLFAFDHDGRTQFFTKTESTALAGKFMLILPNTRVKPFSTVGVAGVHRYDVIRDRWRVSPMFSVGFNYNITEHIMGEAGINYTGGYGESELDPAEDYVPFLYSAFLRLAYRFL